jgi:rubrerythrin
MNYTNRIFSIVPKYLKTDRDFVVLIGGYEGVGKSTLAILLAMITCKGFDIRKDIIYTLEDLEKRLKTVPKYHTLILDEAVEIAFSRKAMHKHQKEIIQIFMQIRQKNLCFIMLIPNIGDIDKYFREHRASRWIEVTKRGEFIVHEKIKNIYKGKVFWRQSYIDSFGPLDEELWMDYVEVKKEAFKRKVEQNGKKGKKKTTKKWPHTCPKCAHSWKGIKEPKNCPSCSRRLWK